MPFEATIPEADQDPELFEKLKSEWPGILQWMIDGCLEWQRDGLQPPERVMSATKDYLGSEDTVQTFIDERCTTDANYFSFMASLFEAYSAYCRGLSEFTLKRNSFGDALVQKGFEKDRKMSGRGFRGICPKPTENYWDQK